jgi:rubrerythrin
MNVTDLMTHSLKEHPEQRNFFKPIPAPEWPNFVDGIDLNGIIVPLFVSARDGVTVLDGHQRLAAARQLGLETVPVVLREFEDEADEVAFMVTVNDGRRHDSAETRANRVDYFLRKYIGKSVSDYEVAAKAGVNQSTAQRRRKQLEAEGEIPVRKVIAGRDGRTYKTTRSTNAAALVGSSKNPTEPKDLTPAKFICPECQDVFTEEVWHCPVCVHHWSLEDDECKNCHQVTRLASGELQVSAFTDDDDEDGEEGYEYPTELPTDDGPELPTWTPSATYAEVSKAVSVINQYSEGQLLLIASEEPQWYPVSLTTRFGYAAQLLAQAETLAKNGVTPKNDVDAFKPPKGPLN